MNAVASSVPEASAPFTAAHWASAYAGFVGGLILTAVGYLSGGFGLGSVGLAGLGLAASPIAAALLAVVILRGGFRLAALGLFLAAPAFWVAFATFFLVVAVV